MPSPLDTNVYKCFKKWEWDSTYGHVCKFFGHWLLHSADLIHWIWHDRSRMLSRTCLLFRNTWFHTNCCEWLPMENSCFSIWLCGFVFVLWTFYFVFWFGISPICSQRVRDWDNPWEWNTSSLICKHVPVNAGVWYSQLCTRKHTTFALIHRMDTMKFRTWNCVLLYRTNNRK